MRKLLLILFGVTLLAMLSNTAMGQSFGNLGLWDMYSIPPQRVIMGAGDKTTRPDTSAALEIRGRKRALFLRGVVHRDSVYAPKIGMIVMDSSDYHLYFRGASGWVALDSSSGGGGADSSIFLTVYAASQTYQPIGNYLVPSDTTGKWWSVSNVFIRPSDTAAMLAPYLRKVDTAAMLLPYQRDADTLVWDATLSDVKDTASAIRSELLNSASTGIRYGGKVTSIGSGQVQVALGAGYICNNTNPSSPIISPITWVSDTLDLSGVNGLHYIYIDSTSTVRETTTTPTSSDYRKYIFLERVNIISGLVSGQSNIVAPLQNYAAQIHDVFKALGVVKTGLTISAASTNLTIAVTDGEIFQAGGNFQISATQPHEVSFAAETPATFRMVTRNGTQGSNTTSLDVTNYDVAGAVTAIPGSSNRATIFSVYKFSGGNLRILYGQDWYNSISEAYNVLPIYTPVLPAAYTDNAILLGYIIAEKGATNLSDSGQAIFVITNRFGGIGGIVPTTSTVTPGLQQVTDAGNTTTNTIIAPTFRANNPTSYGDATSAATVPRSYVFPDADITVAGITTGITNGEVNKSPTSDAVFDELALKQNSLPSQTGHANEFLKTDGSNVSWAAPTSSLGGNTERTYISAQINGKNTGTTTLFTTEASKGRFVITRINYWMVTSAGGSVNGTYNLGWTAAAYSDIQNAAILDRSTATNQQGTPVNNNRVTIPANTAVVLNITTGVTATTFDLYFEVTGHYQIN